MYTVYEASDGQDIVYSVLLLLVVLGDRQCYVGKKQRFLDKKVRHPYRTSVPYHTSTPKHGDTHRGVFFFKCMQERFSLRNVGLVILT